MPHTKKTLRVLHLRSTNFYGGPERQLHRHALAARGPEFEITIASFSEQGRTPDLLKTVAADGIPAKLFEVSSSYDRRSIGLVRRYLQENDVALFCTHDYRSNILGYFATRGTGTRWLAFSRGRTRETVSVRLYCGLERFFFRFADKVIAVSEGEKNALIRQMVPEFKIAVVHNAIDVSVFESVIPVNLKVRFDLPTDALVAVAAGRFSPEKGQIYLVRAAAEALRREDRLRIIMFGDGPQVPAVQRAIEDCGLINRVICPGFEEDVAGCIKAADVVVNPSLSEGLPNVVLEAMALRTPVIATAVGGVPEVVHHNETGLLVPPADAKALAESILRAVSDGALRNQLAENAFRLIVTSFSFDKQARELTAIYRNVLEHAEKVL